ncbi:hypothetical protein [Methylobacterium iners]|nr:hypothetical protein [Methylobacterium iners]
MCRDPRVADWQFRIAFRISQQVDEATGVAIISDETLTDEVPRTDVGKLRRCRNALEAIPWWQVTRGSRGRASVYRFLNGAIDPITEVMAAKREKRNEARIERLKRSVSSVMGGKSDPLQPTNDDADRGVNLTPYLGPQGVKLHRVSPVTLPPLHPEHHPESGAFGTVQDVATGVTAEDPFDRSGWDEEDWQAFYEECAGILEFDGGYSRVDAESMAGAEISKMRAMA